MPCFPTSWKPVVNIIPSEQVTYLKKQLAFYEIRLILKSTEVNTGNGASLHGVSHSLEVENCSRWDQVGEKQLLTSSSLWGNQIQLHCPCPLSTWDEFPIDRKDRLRKIVFRQSQTVCGAFHLWGSRRPTRIVWSALSSFLVVNTIEWFWMSRTYCQGDVQIPSFSMTM